MSVITAICLSKEIKDNLELSDKSRQVFRNYVYASRENLWIKGIRSKSIHAQTEDHDSMNRALGVLLSIGIFLRHLLEWSSLMCMCACVRVCKP